MNERNRLFCSGHGDTHRWVTCRNKLEAFVILGEDTRQATPQDIRHLWLTLNLHEKTSEELVSMFGVTRQAIDLWRKRAGEGLLTRMDHLYAQATLRIEKALDEATDETTVSDVALATGTQTARVREVAQAKGFVFLATNRKRPSDEEIVRLSEGRTWKQLAKECGLSVNTLRNYIYPKPELAQAVCSRLLSEKSGGSSHGKIDLEEMTRLYKEGMTAYPLAQRYDVTVSAIIYWLKKLNLRTA